MPNPVSVNVTSNPRRVITVTRNVTLTCTVVLSLVLTNVSSISVSVIWVAPSGMQLIGSAPIKETNSPPTFTSMLTSVESVGDYSCQVNTISQSSSSLIPSEVVSTNISISKKPGLDNHV